MSRDDFNAFSRCVLDLHVLWHQYCALYDGSEVQAKIALMNQVAPTFFTLDREAWLDRIFLGISRLMDKDLVCGKKTLSVKHIVKQLDSKTAAQTEPLQQRLENLFIGVKSWRHQKISHNDLEVHLGLIPLPDVPLTDIQKLVDALGEIANVISLSVYDETASYTPDTVKGGADRLLKCLQAWQQIRP